MFRTCLPAGRYKENLVNRACREPFGLELRAERPLGRTINPVGEVPPQAAKFIQKLAPLLSGF